VISVRAIPLREGTAITPESNSRFGTQQGAEHIRLGD